MNKYLIILAAVTVSTCSPAPAGIVAETVYMEARGESKAGRLAVASVIWTRAKGNPDKLQSACLAKWQFSCWNNGYHTVKPRNANERAILKELEAVEASMVAGVFKPTGSWTHYHTLTVNPSWSKTMTNKTVIGRHVFGNTK